MLFPISTIGRYQGCCWADDITGGNYGLMTAINLSPRLDNGLLNSSPKTTMFPVVRIQRGCTENIRIPSNYTIRIFNFKYYLLSLPLGPCFKSHQGHPMWIWVFSPYLTVWVFLPHLKLKLPSLSFLH